VSALTDARGKVHPWSRDASGPGLILPDGCLDVIVRPDGEAVVAGPDAIAREHHDDGRHVSVRSPAGWVRPGVGRDLG
jgi:hypothetical protein